MVVASLCEDRAEKMASAGLLEAVAPKKKKSNIKYASTCAVVASMASIVLGYGTHVDIITSTPDSVSRLAI